MSIGIKGGVPNDGSGETVFEHSAGSPTSSGDGEGDDPRV